MDASFAGVETDKQGRVTVDGGFQTTAKGVFAIGDVIDGPMLAHKAEKEGVAVAELIAGSKKVKVDYTTVPGIVYTAPEVANIGFSEQELKEAGVSYKVGKFPFKANSRARAMERRRRRLRRDSRRWASRCYQRSWACWMRRTRRPGSIPS